MPTRKIATRNNSHVEKSSPCKIPTQKFPTRKIPTPINAYKNSIFGKYTFILVTLRKSCIVKGFNLKCLESVIFLIGVLEIEEVFTFFALIV